VHAKGPPDAPVTIVEFSDFSCQHCARASRDLEQLVATRPAEVRLVFRHFPLDSTCNPAVTHPVHPAACAAATAAECAGEAGRFWEFHDYLFAHQDTKDFAQVATSLGLDTTRFRECLASGRGSAAVTRDAVDGAGLGVESTPTLFINGRTVRGALSARLYEFALAIERPPPHDEHGGNRPVE
jgi:protein-disulfide isomerase